MPLAGAPGVYTFDFGTNAIGGPLTLTDGSHFISAAVEIIDPAAAPGTPNVYGFGARSASLEIVVDTTAPAVFFGDPAIANDGLSPDSDSGDPFVPSTLSDRATNDTTPTFFGQAEANGIVRAYVDRTNNGFTADDILIGQTVATPIDGTNQHPFGQWEITSTLNMNDPRLITPANVPAAMQIGKDGVRNIFVTLEDPAGNTSAANLATLQIFIDTSGPQIFDPDGPRAAGPDGILFTADDINPLEAIQIVGAPTYNLFGLKPGNSAQGPTPAVNGLIVNVRDLPNRAVGFLYAAVSNTAPPNAPILVGDHSGVIAISTLTFTSDGNLTDNTPPIAS